MELAQDVAEWLPQAFIAIVLLRVRLVARAVSAMRQTCHWPAAVAVNAVSSCPAHLSQL
jgi:hypothetical protein